MKANGAGVDNSLQQCSVHEEDAKTNGSAVVTLPNDKANSNEVENLMLHMRRDWSHPVLANIINLGIKMQFSNDESCLPGVFALLKKQKFKEYGRIIMITIVACH